MFQLEYGSGNASGHVMKETMSLGSLKLANVRMGRVTRTSTQLQRVNADGVVGLGLDGLAFITRPSLVGLSTATVTSSQAPSTVMNASILSCFSVFFNALPGHLPPSQLILGGVDPSLVRTTKPTWFYFPLMPYPVPARRSLGFWAIAMQQMSVVTRTKKEELKRLDRMNGEAYNAVHSVVAKHSIAIVDSGTSLILLPKLVFDATMAGIQRHLKQRFGQQMEPHSFMSSGFACSQCTPEMFPALVFAFEHQESLNDGSSSMKTKTLMLQGSDYVRCDGLICAPQLDVHSLSFTNKQQGQGNDPGSRENTIVLGAIFMRAYYTVFDAAEGRVGFACASTGRCLGGLNPHLQFQSLGEIDSGLVVWCQIYSWVGAFLFFVAAFAIIRTLFTECFIVESGIEDLKITKVAVEEVDAQAVEVLVEPMDELLSVVSHRKSSICQDV